MVRMLGPVKNYHLPYFEDVSPKLLRLDQKEILNIPIEKHNLIQEKMTIPHLLDIDLIDQEYSPKSTMPLTQSLRILTENAVDLFARPFNFRGRPKCEEIGKSI